MNGMREVLLKTDEMQKQKIPHLVKLGSGQSILVTMQGRPPLCLKCHDVGHTCKDCPSGPSNRRSFAGVAAHGRLPGPQAAEPPVGGNSEPVGSENAPPPQNGGARWLSGRVSDSGARGPGFETYRRRVVSLSKTLYSPKVLVNYPGSDGSVPT